ncbi:MAG: HPr(Ser) kinase/phosphatase [Deltaproteobacteria bacterium]|nr:HPr(Ser) kinase/phosphatase [Deltaproteobacteria bacterium]
MRNLESNEFTITVRDLVSDPALGLRLKVVAGESGCDARIRHNRIQRVGLVLAGHLGNVIPHRIQICGETEISYFPTLLPERREEVLARLFELKLCCLLITCGFDAPSEVRDIAERSGTPLILIEEKTGAAIQAIEDFLDDRLAPRTQIHGVLIDVFGVGMLLIGESGVGKSECALDLVLRGHRLVADDVVLCDYRPPGAIYGAPAGILRHHIEVRGLGVLNIKSLFGVTSVRDRKRIDLVLHLREDANDSDYDRIGIEDHFYNLLGVQIRELVLPVRPGRDMAAIIEIAARDELSRRAGHHSAREFFDTIERRLKEGIQYNQDSIIPLDPCAPKKIL